MSVPHAAVRGSVSVAADKATEVLFDARLLCSSGCGINHRASCDGARPRSPVHEPHSSTQPLGARTCCNRTGCRSAVPSSSRGRRGAVATPTALDSKEANTELEVVLKLQATRSATEVAHKPKKSSLWQRFSKYWEAILPGRSFQGCTPCSKMRERFGKCLVTRPRINFATRGRVWLIHTCNR